MCNIIVIFASEGSILQFQVPEGSACKIEERGQIHSYGVCIQSMCRKVGCDGVLDSNKKENECGICNSGTKLKKIF